MMLSPTYLCGGLIEGPQFHRLILGDIDVDADWYRGYGATNLYAPRP
jgi:hypothetical protein